MILGAMLPLGASYPPYGPICDLEFNVPSNVPFGTAYPPKGGYEKKINVPLACNRNSLRYFTQVASGNISPGAVQ
jgi:hypothetical protein